MTWIEDQSRDNSKKSSTKTIKSPRSPNNKKKPLQMDEEERQPKPFKVQAKVDKHLTRGLLTPRNSIGLIN